ncbi:hypothetical protein [Catenuloplanes japonicus]|uniref:hypothetical protein n=1 Tax=Catenuloplanes japonicus TaxID=33876 RepID=UPI000526D78B|nr:hypothetical protein [Catenuloplanes japonicus]
MVIALIAAAAALFVAPSPATAVKAMAATQTRTLSCAALPGSGSYSDPRLIGDVTGPVVVRDCPALSSGAGFAVRYFRFNLPGQPSASSAALIYYPQGGVGVHPRLVWPPRTVKGSTGGTGYLDQQGYTGFFHPMGDLWAGNGWLLGAEKLRSPLNSTQTSRYNVLITP